MFWTYFFLLWKNIICEKSKVWRFWWSGDEVYRSRVSEIMVLRPKINASSSLKNHLQWQKKLPTKNEETSCIQTIIELLDDHFENSNFDPLIHHYLQTIDTTHMINKNRHCYSFSIVVKNSGLQWIIILIYWADSHL